MSTVSTDPIADMLSRIRNAIAVRKSEVSLPHSKVKESVARILKDNHFIEAVEVQDAPIGKTLRVVISGPKSTARITEIVRLSRPGRRYYAGAAKIPAVKRGRGLVIVSTSKGVLTGDEAKAAGVGGELICKVY
jgi:small subunit ribosomal protein S8